MSANFRLTLPLLERLDDEAVIAWGRAFDWSIPEVDVSTYAGDRQRPGRRLGQPVQPARALLAHGSERLKNLLLRSDMFGNGEPFICEGDIWRSTDRPLDTHHHLWADLWTAAWALGDAASVDRMWTWVPPGVKHLAMFSDRAHFLNDFGRYGKPEHVAEMLKRLKKLIGEDPLSSLSFRGRIKTRERKALVRSMTQAVQVAIRTGNLAWVESVENILHEAVHCPEVVAEAFGSAHFALGRRLFEALPRPPALGEATPP